MKEISLKVTRKEVGASIPEAPKDHYPSFSIYENAPAELLKIAIGTELTAKIKLTSKEIHEGKQGRESVGFDIISVMVNEKPAKKLQKQGSQEYME